MLQADAQHFYEYRRNTYGQLRKHGEIIDRLQQVYTDKIGVEYMHIWDHEQVNWIREQIETPSAQAFSKEEKMRMLDRLCWSDHFEAFLAQKYATAKRFGLEGCEVLIVGMKELIDTATEEGIESVVMGMPHRGRLNVLANVVRKPMEQIFSEFAGTASPDPEHDFSGSGDVKYHLGMSYTRPTISGGKVHLSLVANPSHLEAVNPVVEGKTRAKQHYLGDTDRSKCMSVLLHGDAAFSGQVSPSAASSNARPPHALPFVPFPLSPIRASSSRRWASPIYTITRRAAPFTSSSTIRSASRRTPAPRAPPLTAPMWRRRSRRRSSTSTATTQRRSRASAA